MLVVMARVTTPYGTIFAPTGPCQDDYPNIRSDADRGQVKLQTGAMHSFRMAERRLYVRVHPLKARLKRYRKRVIPIQLTGSWRSCELQASLYAQDPQRYADPDTTLHTRGLAIDVSTTQRRQRLIRKVLRMHGWKQARPDDEPWHYSFWFEA